ncbi:MAG TPA: DUF1697 domain-containing protein [Thermoleophilaceae bacterium]|nr:DUF1697 domain-containing protein [Thermoleophilaceae bacterium]
MATHAAFLRGMNVGGHRITNDDLRAAFARIGFEDVGVFRASGNVAFDGGRSDPTPKIEKGLEAELGYAVPTFVRTAEEMHALAEADPFDGAEGKVQVVFLRKPPPKSVLKRATDTDRLALGPGAELFWLPSGGLMESDLGMDGLEDEVGPGTTRTKGTIEQITKKFFAG